MLQCCSRRAQAVRAGARLCYRRILPLGDNGMKLVEILLPLYDNSGKRTSKTHFAQTERELVRRFGGLTAYSRSPARGFWQESGRVARDDIVVFEVMVKRFDRAWWKNYQRELEGRFRQRQIVIRAADLLLI
jgi:hypothetical protein